MDVAGSGHPHHVELGVLQAHPEAVTSDPVVVMCVHSERAMGGAGLLTRAGHTDIAVLAGGPEDWAQAAGQSLAVGA